MFEKEAEEFERRKHYRYEDNDYCGDIADGIKQAYQKGAEFGYNKANEWHKQGVICMRNKMTDIERAKEYSKEHRTVICCDCDCDCDCDCNYGSQEDIEKAFLAGLKVGRQEKWHDLRKNPDDLPESSIFHEVLNQNGTKMYYDDIFKKWNVYCGGGIVQTQTPIAWFEIPKFEE